MHNERSGEETEGATRRRPDGEAVRGDVVDSLLRVGTWWKQRTADVGHSSGGEREMENELKSIIATNSVPAELIITYNDMHGLWGGTTMTVHGDGSMERQTKEMGAPETELTRKQIDERESVELVRLLIELRAWEQRTADEQPVAGESRAHLTISFKESVSRVWERVNEMAANNRLVQIKTKLEKL